MYAFLAKVWQKDCLEIIFIFNIHIMIYIISRGGRSPAYKIPSTRLGTSNTVLIFLTL